MIAASDPQEFVPSGRQQNLRHPGPYQVSSKKILGLCDDLLLDRLEKVSLKEEPHAEWWLLRQTPNDLLKKNSPPYIKSGGLVHDSANLEHTSKRVKGSLRPKRISDGNFLRHCNKPFSSEKLSLKNETKPNCTIDTPCPDEAKSEVTWMEDELYVKGHTAIWSRGLLNNPDGLDNGRKTLCSYTSPLPIKHALWCTFYSERPSYDMGPFDMLDKSEEPSGCPIPAVCIIDSFTIRVFTTEGEDFSIAVPFSIANVWCTKYGILIEKEIDDAVKNFDDGRATIYSLAYPLDEINPIAVDISSQLHLLNNPNLKVVYTNENPSICMVYDSHTRQHTVYRIRPIKCNEKIDLVNKTNSICPSTASLSEKLKNRFSMWECVKNSKYLPVPSPLNSRPGSGASFCNLHHSKSHSSMATISRCQSPASSVGSPWMPPHNRTSHINASLHLGNSYAPAYSSVADLSKSCLPVISNPSLCLEHMWTDHLSALDDGLSCMASKVFLCDDLAAQNYLCYVVPSKFQLSLVRVDFSGSKISFGIVTSVSAKDAIPIASLHMMAVLERNGNVTLYSGLTPVGKLHIGGTLVQHTPSPYLRRVMSQFHSPFPRRSSLLPHAKQADPKFDEHLLSPVLPEGSNLVPRSNNILHFPPDRNSLSSVITGLQDSIENRITLKYSDGTYYRIILPLLTSNALVDNCIAALKTVLCKETSSFVLIRWYAARNALGTHDINMEQEWEMFQALLFELLGYDTEQNSEVVDCPVTPSSNPKRLKHSPIGTEDDWISLINSSYQSRLPVYITKNFNIKCQDKNSRQVTPEALTMNLNSILFPFIRLIHFSLHLVYEDLKLNVLRYDDLKCLGRLLNKLSCDLGLVNYSVHYWKDFPEVCNVKGASSFSQDDAKLINSWQGIEDVPPNIMAFLNDLIQGKFNGAYSYIDSINDRSKDIIEISALIIKDHQNDLCVDNLIKVLDVSTMSYSKPNYEVSLENSNYIEQAALLMVKRNLTVRDLDTLPIGIYFLFCNNLWKCRENPPSNWPAEAYYLIWRDDLAVLAEKGKKKINHIGHYANSSNGNRFQSFAPPAKQGDNDQSDGMEDIDNPLMKLRFSDDIRVLEARKMLQSSKPVPIVLVQRPDVSDHDFIEEQEKHLYAICTRTMALSVGRGMFTLRTAAPVITEPLPIPQLCLTGKAAPRGSTVELIHIDTPSNMNLWPLFHNGVANGLRISPDASNIDDTWIIFNKPKGAVEQQMEHAGFLMALGLNGHLQNLDLLSTYDYLSKLHEMTSIGVLLGLSAAFRGTCHTVLTKILSIHVEALLPPTSVELDVPQNIQVAALLGVGLVYQGTSHRHIIEVLLSEIGRPPGPEMENSVDRESYSLAAGLALGLVTLKQGQNSAGLSDLNISDTLYYYMVGGNKRPLTGAQKDKYKVPSFQIREGSSVNLDVTAPGATIALGLMYLGTGNKAVANWMAPPETQYLLDFVRPDFLMFRILARALILWDDVKPSKEWVENEVPNTIRPHCMVKPCPNLDIDYEAMNQAYCYIVTGACFTLGLKYAGSADKDAFETLLHFCHMFTRLTVKSIAELAGKPTVETCLNVLLVSTAMVMAGTGSLEVMRLVRFLRRRVGVASHAIVTYGSHLAIHMSLGLLFLGGGRYTLSNTPENIAALICAFYPKFPTHSNDNRYHLQAFRHLYVLAVEPRLVIPRDVHSGKNCYANLQIVKLDGTASYLKGPVIIPDLSSLSKVTVDDERYWPVVFERGRNWDLLINILSTTGFIEVKQRAGCLNYLEDKFGYHSQLARTLTQSQTVPWDPPPSAIISFTHDQAVKHFCEHFLVSSENRTIDQNELKMRQMLTKITYDAVVKDKMVIVPVFTYFIKVIRELRTSPNALNLWQFKLISSQLLAASSSNNLLSAEIVLSLEQSIAEVLDEWKDLCPALQCYLTGVELRCENDILKKLAVYVTYYDVSYNDDIAGEELCEVLRKFQNRYSAKTVRKILSLCNRT